MARRKPGTSPFIVIASGDDLSVLPDAGGQRPVRLAGDGPPDAPANTASPDDTPEADATTDPDADA
jgi:hypothetical protein